MQNHQELRNVGIFTTLSFLYSWPLFFLVDAWLVPLFLRQENLATARLVLVFGHLLGMLGPALAALFMWRVWHKESLPPWQSGHAKYYGWTVLATLLFWGAPGLVGVMMGDTLDLPIEMHRWIMIGTMLGIGWFAGVGEELGWCAYLLSRLAPRIGRVRAMMVSGAIRGLWHWPVLIGPIIADVVAGERSFVSLLIFSLLVAFQLVWSNILVGAVFGWCWYRTKSIPLLGWMHQWYDLMRDVTILLLVGYGKSLWATSLSSIILSGLGCWLLFRVSQEEGSSWRSWFVPMKRHSDDLREDSIAS